MDVKQFSVENMLRITKNRLKITSYKNRKAFDNGMLNVKRLLSRINSNF